MKQKIHLICNAHIDPVWLWTKQEGVAEAISTFRVAAEFCEKYDGFIFNHNESLLYEWVEEYEPHLFERIKKLVKQGKWKIMGGWYIQPDCLMPCGESLIRQIEVGNQYFMDKFGVKPTTAINFDSFGHSRGLVQILKKTGYDSYVFMRPHKTVPQNDFIWEGYDGSKIIGHNTNSGYNSLKGKALDKIKNSIKRFHNGDNLVLWGIGNHGGGPSRIDLENINEYIKSEKEYDVIHSYCENYFKNIDTDSLDNIDRSMVHCMVGCYTSMAKIKKNHRSLENMLSLCEKMLAVSNVNYCEDKLKDAEKALLFSEFHDSLPGTMIKEAEENVVQLINHGNEILSGLCEKAFFKLCEGQNKAKDGEIPILVFNPNPYDVTRDIEIEYQLGNQNWNDNEYTIAKIRDDNGNYLVCQNEKESSSINLDWRKRLVFRANLKPMQINRFDCEMITIKSNGRPMNAYNEDDNYFVFENENRKILINKHTGLIDEYSVLGTDYIKKSGIRLTAYEDNEDPWGMRVSAFPKKKGEFILMDKNDVNTFNGYPDVRCESVRIVENGDVRAKIQSMFKWSRSYAIVTYIIPKNDVYFDINVHLFVNDTNTMFRLSVDTMLENGCFYGQSAYGREALLKTGDEVTFQKWAGLFDDNKNLVVFNKSTYGGCCNKGELNLSLMRTAVYSAHPIEERVIVEQDRWTNHMDMGESVFDFRIKANVEYVDAEAEEYNVEPYALSFFPCGSKKTGDRIFKVNNKNIVNTRFVKRNEDTVVRLYNASNKPEKVIITTDNGDYTDTFKPYEFKTYVYNDSFYECNTMDTIFKK